MIWLKIFKLFAIAFMMLCYLMLYTVKAADTISLFPLDHYSQAIEDWIKPSDPNYDKSLLTSAMQKYHVNQFFAHTFGTLSPWDSQYIAKILQQNPPHTVKNYIQNNIAEFNNLNKPEEKIGYHENFRPYSQKRLQDIVYNINLNQLTNLYYKSNHRAIAVDNLHARVLPTDDVYFHHYKFAGQGYPFDILQMSSLWAGTPVYVIAETRDRAWSLVITPEYIAWIKSSGIFFLIINTKYASYFDGSVRFLQKTKNPYKSMT